MKKFLVFFVVLFGITSGVFGEDAGYLGSRTDDGAGVYKNNLPCVYIPASNKWDSEPYKVFFNTGKYDIPSGCEYWFNRVKQELEYLWDGGSGKLVTYFGVAASADSQNRSGIYRNDILSDNRYEFVMGSMMPSGSFTKEGWKAGDVTSNSNSSQADNYEYRAVYIYPHARYREPVAPIKCNQDFLDSLNAHKADLDKIKLDYDDSDDEYENKEDVLQEIDKAMTQIEQCKGKCPNPGRTEWSQQDIDYVTKNCIGGAIFADLSKKAPTIIQEYSIDISKESWTEIDILYAKMQAIIAGLRLSEWRDAEGKFNTARLASDATAGVILGTVGGIVTAHLVKKNQLKKGFEDINCSVGGRSFVQYGDQMQVGLQ